MQYKKTNHLLIRFGMTTKNFIMSYHLIKCRMLILNDHYAIK
jgi:hypothetical protein